MHHQHSSESIHPHLLRKGVAAQELVETFVCLFVISWIILLPQDSEQCYFTRFPQLLSPPGVTCSNPRATMPPFPLFRVATAFGALLDRSLMHGLCPGQGHPENPTLPCPPPSGRACLFYPFPA